MSQKKPIVIGGNKVATNNQVFNKVRVGLRLRLASDSKSVFKAICSANCWN